MMLNLKNNNKNCKKIFKNNKMIHNNKMKKKMILKIVLIEAEEWEE